MKTARAARLAWSLCVACLVGLGAYLLLYVLNGTAGQGSTPLLAALTFTVVGALFAVVGALVASRQPDNKVGWLQLAVGLCLAVTSLGES
jgi:ABC-type branched-subunit amino acid transport system permease subunit